MTWRSKDWWYFKGYRGPPCAIAIVYYAKSICPYTGYYIKETWTHKGANRGYERLYYLHQSQAWISLETCCNSYAESICSFTLAPFNNSHNGLLSDSTVWMGRKTFPQRNAFYHYFVTRGFTNLAYYSYGLKYFLLSSPLDVLMRKWYVILHLLTKENSMTVFVSCRLAQESQRYYP